jgi:hypothetical protein
MNTPVNITALHAAIKTALAAQFPTAAVDHYGRPGETLQTPALLIDLDEIDASTPDTRGTEQTEVVLRFNVYAVVKFGQGKKLAVRELAASVLSFVRGKRWSQPIGAAIAVGAYPDNFRATNPPANVHTEEYEVMRVEFTHEATLGADVWEFDADPPTEVWVREQGNPAEEIELD